MASSPPPPPGAPPPPPPSLPPPPPLPPPGGFGVPGDDWQLPGDRWLPGGYNVPAGRPGWHEPVGWQHVGAPEPDPLVARAGYGDWWNKLVAVITRSWRPMLVLQLVLLPLTVVAAVAVVPLTRGSTTAVSSDGRLAIHNGELAARLGALGVAAVLGWIAGIVAQGAGAWVIAHDATGTPTTWSAAVRFGFRRFWAFVGWAIVAGLVTAVGFVACLLPGVWLAVVFNASLVGVVAFERGDTFGRCFALAKGAWWGLLGRTLTVLVVSAVYGGIVGSIATGLVPGDTTVSRVLAAVLAGALRAPAGILAAAAAIVTYAERRGATDGATAARLLADVQS